MRIVKSRVLSGVLFLLLLILNAVYLCTSDPWNVSFLLLFILLLTSGTVFYCLRRYGKVPFWRGRIRKVGNGVLLVGIVFYSLVSFALLVYAGTRTPGKADYLMVLGAGLRGERPTQVLVNRLERAHRYLRGYPEAKAILCGGRGRMETVSEAQAMRQWLVARGIAPRRLLTESRSRNTGENIRNAVVLMGEKKLTGSVVILTSEFHLFRAGYIARREGLRPGLLAAPSPWYLLPVYLFREQLAIVKVLLF